MPATARARTAVALEPVPAPKARRARTAPAADPIPIKPKGKGKAKEAAAEGPVKRDVTIPAPDLRVVEFALVGTAPYVQHRFSKKAAIMQAQAEGPTTGKKKPRTPKDFDQNYEDAKHKTAAGRIGIPASAFRHAMISACRLVGFHMSRAKLSIFVVADDIDIDGLPVVHIEGKPEQHTAHVRNESGVIDIRARPMWRKWSCVLRVQYDADQFQMQDIANLVARAGMQVGVGEGRHDSKKSLAGMGWGTFAISE